MQKLIVNQDVYIIVERWSPEYGLRIAKCKVKGVPSGSMKEYTLSEGGHMYWASRSNIYEFKADAIDEAERQADVYDDKWGGLFRCRRYWKEGNI